MKFQFVLVGLPTSFTVKPSLSGLPRCGHLPLPGTQYNTYMYLPLNRVLANDMCYSAPFIPTVQANFFWPFGLVHYRLNGVAFAFSAEPVPCTIIMKGAHSSANPQLDAH